MTLPRGRVDGSVSGANANVELDDRMGVRVATALGWLFRDRRTGRIVIVQFPNVPLAVWIIATALRWLVAGHLDAWLGIIATVALVVWTGDEIRRGVNPWRRFLGALVLGALIARLSMIA